MGLLPKAFQNTFDIALHEQQIGMPEEPFLSQVRSAYVHFGGTGVDSDDAPAKRGVLWGVGM